MEKKILIRVFARIAAGCLITGVFCLVLIRYFLLHNQHFEYKIEGEEVVITGYSGTAWFITIPDSIEEKPVTAVGEEAFYQQYGIRRVVLPDGIRVIGKNSFFGCIRLEQINFPESLKSIETGAFSCCIRLDDISIGARVARVAPYAFYGCTRLSLISLPEDLEDIGVGAFERCAFSLAVTE